jgi:hypothetical protein
MLINAFSCWILAMFVSHGGRQCWGYPKIRIGSPNTREGKNGHVQFKYTDDAEGDLESPKDCSSLKSCESSYTCPHAPFYREAKGL